MSNLILDTDSYKSSHYKQYPPGTEYVYSYIESRGGRWEKTVFFGLQYIINKYLKQQVTKADVDEAEEVFKLHGLPFPREGWDYIVSDWKGRIPLTIRAVPEGLVVPTHNVLVTVENVDPKLAWLVGWFETMLMRVWYPITVATQSWYCKRTIMDWLYRTSDANPKDAINFKLHDFGARGVSSRESAGIGGAAHLVNFMGSDTVEALMLAREFYWTPMAGFSIPAAEHSTMTSWGGREGEAAAMENMLDQFGGPGKIIACVSDSYSLKNACLNIWGDKLKAKIIALGAQGGKLVVRPDSGHPPQIVLETLEMLGEKFGHTTNSKGYKLLPPYLGVIQGDGVNGDSIQEILANMARHRWSADNVAFGMGGALLQQVNRDTQRFAMKCSSIQVNGQIRDVFKDPETDHGKRSKKGRLKLVCVDGEYKTIPEGTVEGMDFLRIVFSCGNSYFDQTLTEVRERANKDITKGLWSANDE